MQDISLLLWLLADIRDFLLIFNSMLIFTYFCIYPYSSFLHLLKATQDENYPMIYSPSSHPRCYIIGPRTNNII